MKTTGIYRIITPSGRIYIGQSINIENRIRRYKKAEYCNRKLYYSIMKYGWENHEFDIIHVLLNSVSQDVLNHYEQYYMDFYRNNGFKLLNVREGGSSGATSEETKEKIRKALTGHLCSPETREKIRLANLGYVASEETRQKLSLAGKGKPTYMKGKKHSEETKKKMRESGRNRVHLKHTEETKEKLRKAITGKKGVGMFGHTHSEKTKEKMRQRWAQRRTNNYAKDKLF